MKVNLERVYEIAHNRMLELAPYMRVMCGKVWDVTKSTQSNVRSTPIHEALTYMDMHVQDTISAPILREFPHLFPIFEEITGLEHIYTGNTSDETIALDPIDGTEGYCNGQGDYSIMLSILCNGEIVLGIGFYPKTETTFAAIKGEGAWKADNQGNREPLKKLEEVSFDPMQIAAHYRFFVPPYNILTDRLLEKGYATIPTLGKRDIDFGTNLTGILRIAKGKSCAYIGPHIALHDFSAPTIIIQQLGGVIQRFDYNGEEDICNWKKLEPIFTDLGTNKHKRFRIIIANSSKTIDRIICDMSQPTI